MNTIKIQANCENWFNRRYRYFESRCYLVWLPVVLRSDSDLLGIPVRLTISKRTFKEGKLRAHPQSELVTYDGALKAIATFS
jgi:hypothetical protein